MSPHLFVRLLVACALLGLLALPSEAAPSSAARKAYRQLLDRVAPRRGIQHRHLIVVPLVLKTGAPKGSLVVETSTLSWLPGSEKKPDTSATLTWPEGTPAAGAPPVLVPSGLMLRAGKHERLVLRPALIERGRAVTLRTISLAPFETSGTAEGASPSIGSLAPPEYRHTLYLVPKAAAARDVLALEASALGIDPKKSTPTLRGLGLLPSVAKRIEAAAAAVRPLGKAFGGETVGHAAFLGTGLVQLVLARDPATYASYVRVAAEGLAMGLVAWEEIYDRAAPKVEPVRWERYLGGTERVLSFLREASFKKERRRDERGARGELWRVRATRATKGGRPPDVGWLLLDEDDAPVWFEGWPDNAPLPPPPSDPADPGSKERDAREKRKQGSYTWYFAKRFYERFPWRREPEWLRHTKRPALQGK